MIEQQELPPKNHNRSPFEISEQEIADLYDEARHWLDGDEIASQEQADI